MFIVSPDLLLLLLLFFIESLLLFFEKKKPRLCLDLSYTHIQIYNKSIINLKNKNNSNKYERVHKSMKRKLNRTKM